MAYAKSRWFLIVFLILIALFIAHLVMLSVNSRSSFLDNIESAKDISTALGLFSALFSGFAAFGLIYTMEMQREALKLQSIEVKQGAELQIRMLHMELIKLSLADPALEKVWSGSTAKMTGNQSMYTNLILSHWQTMFVSDLLTEQSLHNLLAERMHGIMVQFWAKHRDSRREHAIAAEGRHLAFHEIVDEHFLKASVKPQVG